MDEVSCTNCHRLYPADSNPFRCPTCGGIYDYAAPFEFDPQTVDPLQPGIWRYRHAFNLPENAPVLSLGEGGTPLVWSEAFGCPIAFKLEYLNPTGSFKDRGTATLVSRLLARGVTEAVEDSSGNAGASLAAYAARAGIQARVFVPDYASPAKRAQIGIYGARLVRILGPRSQASEAVRRAAADGVVYASHAYLPFGLPGLATVAFELVDQIGEVPGSILMPVGQGSLLLGLARGFKALLTAREIDRLPKLVGVQARACAPLWAAYTAGQAGLGWVSEGDTAAEGVRILHPLRGDAVLAAVEASQGTILAVEEADITEGRERLARLGFLVEPTSAIVWGGLAQVVEDAPEPIVAVLTGTGFKSLPSDESSSSPKR